MICGKKYVRANSQAPCELCQDTSTFGFADLIARVILFLIGATCVLFLVRVHRKKGYVRILFQALSDNSANIRILINTYQILSLSQITLQISLPQALADILSVVSLRRISDAAIYTLFA